MPILALFFVLALSVMLVKALSSSTQVPTLTLTEENSTHNSAVLEKGWGEASSLSRPS